MNEDQLTIYDELPKSSSGEIDQIPTHGNQSNGLLELRETIQKRRISVQNALGTTRKREVVEVPIVEKSDSGDFDMERYDALTKKVDALYNNYLVSKETFENAGEQLKTNLKELADSIEETLKESFKCKF